MMKIEDLLEYDPETGRLSWRVKRGRCAAGSEAGTIGSYGYREIAINGKKFKAHRIAWYLTQSAASELRGDFVPVVPQ